MKVFNTITRSKEEFKPIKENVVTMYVCGPTVYDLFHIGNARTFVFFDVARKYLEYKGYEVKFIQNFTDIDDKIINKANEENKTINQISEKYIDSYYEDADKLNIKRATYNPKATENIQEMVDVIDCLIKNEYAYEVSGDVYFSISSFPDYGILFGQDLKTLKSGSRVKINENKRDSLDFILWKKANEDEVGYDSPWGKGRPGWHTECCSMIHKYFNGEVIDIHGGGFDLIFPHHENEIAQIGALTGKPLANYWMHCAFLSINKQKMSKSLGNFFTTREILEKYSSSALRFFILSSHYRNELYFSEDQISWAEKSLERIYKCYSYILEQKKLNLEEAVNNYLEEIKNFKLRFIERMDDDFNTSDGISVIFEFIRYVNTYGNKFTFEELEFCCDFIDEFFDIFGIEYNKNQDNKVSSVSEEVREMIIERYKCKKNKDFETADRLRNELINKQIIVEDIANGVRVLDLNTKELIDTILY